MPMDSSLWFATGDMVVAALLLLFAWWASRKVSKEDWERW